MKWPGGASQEVVGGNSVRRGGRRAGLRRGQQDGHRPSGGDGERFDLVKTLISFIFG